MVAKLKPELWTTLICIAVHMDGNGQCFPTQQRIAEMMGISRTTANKYIQQLEKIEIDGEKIIKRVKKRNMITAAWDHTVYTINANATGVSIFDLAARQKSQKLLDLKNMPYAEYLKTAHWKKLRGTVLKRFEYRCAICNSNESIEVHHRTYERRGEERLTDLTALCDKCHELYHQNQR
ncbi:helix-turn-helix domain-containing protein [Paenibacillus phyllosphaerae]